ncbi:unnamed protein product [Rotaria magnacalcarata]|uniref:Endonuclease/exonuclease/phosphatase domain-containing protein n=1 Tax=Rotaria magnacalcarata TaxID=392030 RepID=A0A816V091_9BILA|nr:unnamed protein product [Rotaria magnacalcarata]CAF2133928.1 unnamed protein product [Rotaria magnacalcarata]CAF4001765.1 unnamed protein product [Rotaria magnacalcarata]CAF4389223.1 unnamed protein product [Rotaria magnacalcarata]
MSNEQSVDLRLLSWNILAPCLVIPAWYPTVYEIASQHTDRINKIANKIDSLKEDVVLIQEAQEDTLPLLRQKLGITYSFYIAWNNPTEVNISHGLLMLIRKDWKYASTVIVTHGILDLEKGEAIQIMSIPSENVHVVNLHLNYVEPLAQAKMVLDKSQQLLGETYDVTILAGDMNAEKEVNIEFESSGFENAFNESNDDIKIPTYYPDPAHAQSNSAIDHIFYDPRQIQLIEYGKAWNITHGLLSSALTEFGSDHIYVWASFKFHSRRS